MNTRKNTLYNVAYRVFSMLLPLVTAPYLSRVVGTEGVGLYGYSWAISYVFVLIGLLGLENYGPREIARVRDDRDALNRTFSAIWKMQRLACLAGIRLFHRGRGENYLPEPDDDERQLPGQPRLVLNGAG